MITARNDPSASLGRPEVVALAQLLDRHFHAVTEAQVTRDLADKTAIIRLFDGERLIGFSTFAYARIRWLGEEIGAVWSGDTIVDPVAWHAAALPAAWLRAVRSLHGDRGRLAWCLICSGVRTWRFMTSCCLGYAPGPEASAEMSSLRDHLARLRYGDDYHAGIVRLAQPQPLRRHLLDLPPHLARDPACAVFEALNPGHAHGDELACAAWLGPATMTRIGRAAWARSTA